MKQHALVQRKDVVADIDREEVADREDAAEIDVHLNRRIEKRDVKYFFEEEDCRKDPLSLQAMDGISMRSLLLSGAVSTVVTQHNREI